MNSYSYLTSRAILCLRVLLFLLGFKGFLGLHGQSSGKVQRDEISGENLAQANGNRKAECFHVGRGSSRIFVDVLYLAI